MINREEEELQINLTRIYKFFLSLGKRTKLFRASRIEENIGTGDYGNSRTNPREFRPSKSGNKGGAKVGIQVRRRGGGRIRVEIDGRTGGREGHTENFGSPGISPPAR